MLLFAVCHHHHHHHHFWLAALGVHSATRPLISVVSRIAETVRSQVV